MFPLLSGGKVFKNNLFLLRVVSLSEKGSPPASQARALRAGHFCFSVSKKVAKNAVVRNRLRRTGYRLLGKYIPQIKPGILAIFSFRTMPKNNDDIIKNLESILNDSLL